MAKAQFATIITWVLVLAATIIIFFTIQNMYSTVSDVDPELVACKQQVLHQQRLTQAQNNPLLNLATNNEDSNKYTISCPTQQRTLPLDKEIAFEQIAEDLLMCKELWGEGVIFHEEGIYCHVCAFTQFEEAGELQGLNQYLSEHAYAQMIRGVRSSEQLPDVSGFAHQDVLDTSKQYATIFYHAEGQEQVQAFGQSLISRENVMRGVVVAGGVGAGATAGAVAACFIPGIGWGSCLVGGAIAGIILIGAPIGAFTAGFVTNTPEYASTVLFTEWDVQAVRDLGCQYAPIRTT